MRRENATGNARAGLNHDLSHGCVAEAPSDPGFVLLSRAHEGAETTKKQRVGQLSVPGFLTSAFPNLVHLIARLSGLPLSVSSRRVGFCLSRRWNRSRPEHESVAALKRRWSAPTASADSAPVPPTEREGCVRWRARRGQLDIVAPMMWR